MIRYIIIRLLLAIPVLLVVTILVFSLIHLAPGDPVQLLMGIYGDPVHVEMLREKLNLDKPIIIQYFLWMKNLLKGDLGLSIRSRTPVLEMILERYPKTFILAGLGLSISIVLSIISGVIAAYKRNTAVDFSVMTFAIIGISIPQFWMAIMLILVFSLFLGILPSMGYVPFLQNPIASIKHLILPAFALGIAQASITARMTRSEMLEILGQDYIKTARAKGLRERSVLFKHALKNALIPIVTILGIQFAFLMGGTVVIEEIFVYPGLGKLAVDSIFNRDYTQLWVIGGEILKSASVCHQRKNKK